MLPKQEKLKRRHQRIRAKISGTEKVPRLCVFRSNKHIYAQLIDDEKARVILLASDFEIKKAKIRNENFPKVAIAFKVGELVAHKALKKGIEKVVFDRRGYKYHGRVKALAEGARKGGLKF